MRIRTRFHIALIGVFLIDFRSGNTPEIVGARIVSIPTGLAEPNALKTFWSFVAHFATLCAIINIMLTRPAVRPITRIAELSEEISKGKRGLPEFAANGAGEIRNLQTAFSRMRRSIEKAIKVVQLQKDLLRKP